MAHPDCEPEPHHLNVARSRRDPFFYIVDHDLTVMSLSVRSKEDLTVPGSLPAEVVEAVKRLLNGKAARPGTRVAALEDDTIIRLVPTGGKLAGYVIFVEPFQSRDVLGAAARHYQFTVREIEVIKLLLRGDSTDAMAAELFISDLTVLQHVKNIGRRMGLSKRREIIATLLGIR